MPETQGDEQNGSPAMGGDRQVSRTRNRKKQLLFQKHKARMSAGSSLNVASPAKGTTKLEPGSPEHEPANGKAKNPQASGVKKNRDSPSKANNVSKDFAKDHVPRRHNGAASSRKAEMFRMMKAKKSKTVTPTKKTNETEQASPEPETCGEQEEQKNPVGGSELQTSLPTVSDTSDSGQPTSDGTPKLDTSVGNAVEATEKVSPSAAVASLNEIVDANDDNDYQFEDPPLEDVKSEVSAFDMRSIHECPPSPSRKSEDENDTGDDQGKVAEGAETGAATQHRTKPEATSEMATPQDEETAVDESAWTTTTLGATPEGKQGVAPEEEKKEKESTDPPVDSSWDATNPFFSQTFSNGTTETPKGSTMDMFDTSSWGNAEVAFSDVSISRLMQQPNVEARILENAKRNVELAERAVRAKAAESSNEEKESCKLLAGAAYSEAPKDDQPLLGAESSSVEDAGPHSSEPVLTMEQRIEMYTAEKEDDEESSAGEGDIETEQQKDNEEGVLEIGYISQDSEDEGDDIEDTQLPQELGRVQDVATFEVSATAAVTASTSPNKTEVVENASKEDMNNNVEEAKQPSMLGDSPGTISPGSPAHLASLPPPPPPPPGEKKKKKRGNSKPGVPLIAPPPPEKLKKWEDEKMRGHRHLAALKAKKDALAFEGGIPEVTRLEEPSLFASPSDTQKVKSPSEKARSPSNGESVLSDTKMAEKVAMASSAAALAFEEQMERKNPAGASHVSPVNGEATELDGAGGAFKSWGTTGSEIGDLTLNEEVASAIDHGQGHLEGVVQDELSEEELMAWFFKRVLGKEKSEHHESESASHILQTLLENDGHFNALCQHISDSVNKTTADLGVAGSFDEMTWTTASTGGSSKTASGDAEVDKFLQKKRPLLKPVCISEESQGQPPNLLAANFVSFLSLASKLARVESPFGNTNPFLSEIVNKGIDKVDNISNEQELNSEQNSMTAQQLIFNDPNGKATEVVQFAYNVCKSSENQAREQNNAPPGLADPIDDTTTLPTEPPTPCAKNTGKTTSRRFIVPEGHPSPFEEAVWAAPRLIAAVLSFLGDPVAVCRVKMLNRFCCRIVSENEHMIMQDAVRVGGLSMNVRPAFWMWITLQKCSPEEGSQDGKVANGDELLRLERRGQEGNWHHVIERDVARSFGNMPPHKTGARLRNDSIVRALVTWGQNRIMRRGVKGGGEEKPLPELGQNKGRKDKNKSARCSLTSPPWECPGDEDGAGSDISQTPTDTVSDWGGVSPVASMVDSVGGAAEGEATPDNPPGENTLPTSEELALSGNFLTSEMKADLQGKLSFILHSLAAAHEDVGYCQGLDYVVAHLLRNLQDTIRWKALQGALPGCITTAPESSEEETTEDRLRAVDKTLVVEETVFRVMDTFFTTYNLRHMYWPELRCLKTCCRVFERLIQIKLPVLADHFEHHDLNVGLFALGWFQTLFLYLPSMPSATVCHMWDIWLVERSFKIFFRVGTAILFLSQPLLLNHELEGMMTYLNTIPDATLLKPDILIACALNIKVTNRMLQELEAEVTANAV